MVFSNRAASKVTKNLREISIFLVGNMERAPCGNQPTGKYPLVRRRVRPSQCRAMHASVLGGEPWGGRA